MSDSDLIAAFLASKGATVVPVGMRSMESSEMRAAVRGDAPAHRSEDALHDAASEARMNGHRVTGFNGDCVTTEHGEY